MSTGSVQAIAMLLTISAATALAQPQEPVPLRSVRDASRHQLWTLQQDGVYLYDTSTRALKRRFELPGWIYVGEPYSCGPGLAVDAQGAAVVSSDVVPVLWRVDPINSRVSRHELVLDADADKDVGFTDLAYAADQGVFFAVSSTYGSLWRIDPMLRKAQKLPLSLAKQTPAWRMACVIR